MGGQVFMSILTDMVEKLSALLKKSDEPPPPQPKPDLSEQNPSELARRILTLMKEGKGVPRAKSDLTKAAPKTQSASTPTANLDKNTPSKPKQ